MKYGTWALGALLYFGILALWAPERWAWSTVQTGTFVLAACCAVTAQRFPGGVPGVTLMAAAAWPLVQLAAGVTFSRGLTWMAALDWWTFTAVFLATVHLLSSRAAHNWFLRASVLGGALLAVIAVGQKYSSRGAVYWIFPSGFDDDVLGPFVNRNQFAAWIELLLPIALWLAATARRRRSIYGVAAAAMFSSVIASASRAGCALVLVETAAVLILLAHRNSRREAGLFARATQFTGLAAGGILVMGYNGLLDRLAGLHSEKLRIDALRASWQMLKDRPWMGSGLGTWPTAYPAYAGFDSGLVMNQAHNDWAQCAAEGGLPFLFLLILFAALLWKPALRSIYGVGIVAFLVHALLDYPMQQRPALAACFFAIAGAVYAGRNVTHPGRNHDLLRRVGRRTNGVSRRDKAGVQAPCTANSP